MTKEKKDPSSHKASEGQGTKAEERAENKKGVDNVVV